MKKEKAEELFLICRELAEEAPSTAGTRQLHQIIALCAAEGCRHQQGTFGNLFSQVDFVCKTLGMKADQRRAIHTARRHSNMSQPIDQAEWLYDLRAVSLLISAVFDVPVPSDLLRLLPLHQHPQAKGLKINKLYVRCLVRSFDTQTIVADTGEGDIEIDYGNTDQGRDFAYLQKILREGMQLNLLDCHVVSQSPLKVIPGIIVIEPDYLVDISALAACFTDYGHHPLLYTVNRLKPAPNTQPILLGNFAGAALDDIINNPEVTTAQTLRRSFREQALRFCACSPFNAEQFKRDAERQMRNIRASVGTGIKGTPLLEPSFICEQLGLQGRVDLMTADLSLLVEQKAGKNMNLERGTKGRYGWQREDHYVQMMLYYGVLHYNFRKSTEQIDAQLLYSRYPSQQGLIHMNYYLGLFREAIKVRNQIAAIDLLIARDGFERIMPLLNADTIYQGISRDAFFQNYIQPGVTALSTLLSALSPLERAYYQRMMTFVYREQVCQKLGSSEQTLHHTGGSSSDLWLMPLSEKQEAGTIITCLTIAKQERSSEYGGYDIITLLPSPSTLPQSPSTSHNFRRGDMVYLYRYDGEPDVRHSILFKGTLSKIDNNEIVVALNDGQQDASIFATGSGPWTVEHGSSDMSANAQIRSLHQFIQAPEERKALLLGQRMPQADTTLTLSKAYSLHYDDILLKMKQARDYFLLVGPPGTGKTSMALRFMVEEELATTPDGFPSGLLLMAYTNRAVDEICAMLCNTGLDFVRLGNAASCDERFHSHLLDAQMADATLAAIRHRLSTVPIVVSTTSMLQARPFIFQVKHFSLAIVDEASQILEPSLIGLLSHPQIDRFVLIGDHKQLPAVVQQNAEDARVDDVLLRGIGLTDCRQSLFERLYRWEQAQERTQFAGTLIHQGRMHPDVALFPSNQFYHGQLQTVPLSHQQETALHYAAPSRDTLDDILKTRRVVFLSVSPNTRTVASETVVSGFPADTSNPAEARTVADLVLRLQRFYGPQFDPEKTIGIIVPYRNQIDAIRQAIATLAPSDDSLQQITIDTVERYQGSQREVIIYSFTVSRLYQLDFLTANTYDYDGQPVDRKLNVALTRARRQMIMVGNGQILRHNALFRQLISSFSVKI